jgi:hypothetical protein
MKPNEAPATDRHPRFFSLIAAWCCLALSVHASALTRPMKAYETAGKQVPLLWYYLPLFALAFVIWQTLGLVQLRRFNRWFAVVFFVWWAMSLLWHSTIALRRPSVKLVPAILIFSVLVTLNLLSTWYLCLRSFREFAVRYAAERDKEKHSHLMQKLSQKKILDDARK